MRETGWGEREDLFTGRRKLKTEKNRIAALTSTAVSEPFEALGNLTRRKRRSPNSATGSRHKNASSAEFIHPDHANPELKKSQRIHEEGMKTGPG
jgi:hypothetical protein